MKSHNHYEAAFEACIRAQQAPYVAVDEAKRAAFRDAKLKNFDFIVYSRQGTNWLVDVKGRRWKARRNGGRPQWENWATQADLDGMMQWEEVFGPGFAGLLMFAYDIDPSAPQPPEELVFRHRNKTYVFAGVTVRTYKLHCRVRSPKWGTVRLPARDYARLVRPLADWL